MVSGGDTIALASGTARAEIALRGAEPVRWQVGGQELLWRRDPEHWAYAAPILFPVVGASRGGTISVDGQVYPMAQHGFARTLAFSVVERTPESVRLRLEADAATRAQYPFDFTLDVTTTLSETGLALHFAVTNAGAVPMPYGLGVHPAFLWPFDAPDRDGHRIVFEADETPRVPDVAPGGLLARSTHPVPLEGRSLPLDPALFTEALVFLDARSRSIRFESPSGASIELAGEGFAHLAVWSRPTAPFLSLEAWTAHADWEDAAGDLAQRASMIVLPPGHTRHHRAHMIHRAA